MIAVLAVLAISASAFGGYIGNSSRVCRMGPPLPAPGGNRANVAVLGDSVSIGWEVPLASQLSDVALVQHAPFSGDGGALDTKYQVQCFEELLTLSNGASTSYDVVVYNSGLHDANYSGNYPEEFTPIPEYAANLVKVFQAIQQLSGKDTKLVWIDTTPVPWNATLSDLVLQYTAAAHQALAPYVAGTVNLYKRVTDICGNPPYTSCNISNTSPSHPSPHYTTAGYEYLASGISPVVRQVLKQSPSSSPSSTTSSPSSSSTTTCGTFTYNGSSFTASCPTGSTCLDNSWSYTKFGCCQIENAVDCKDSWHCCPQNTKCSNCSMYGCDCLPE